uniref:Uncharacterized protein n=1 Tax=Ananas comosus var. bracteatus TaxID=296719 RepID=A0A6V7PV29_ANACO|nr:unnamed protein product [Ananas comosus var. bracteatus]
MARLEESIPSYGFGNLSKSFSDAAQFDASQYEFFGKDVAEEVELGGLDDAADGRDGALGDEEDQFSYLGDRAEDEVLGSLSDVDDLVSTFSKLNKIVSEPKRTAVLGHRGSFSRESSTATDWALEPGFSNWLDQQILGADNAQDGKRWWSQPHPSSSSAHFRQCRPLYRTSSSPQQQQLYDPNEPIPVPKSPYNLYPPRQELPQASPNNLHHRNIRSPLQRYPSLSSQISLAGIPRGPHYGGHQLGSAYYTPFLPNLMQQQNSLMPPQLLPARQQIRFNQVQPYLPHLNSPPETMNRFSPMHGMAEMSDPRAKSRQVGNGRPRFQSKYMSAEEIESISRIQQAATHSSDPYIDDYYHQACLAKKASNSETAHYFCPNITKSNSSQSRGKDDPQPYLHIDGLGRLPFSSIKRPRPLLEVDPFSLSVENRCSMKPLEQEPMLVARIIIENGFALLLDIDDINRLLQFTQPQDGGSQLRKRKQLLLEALAASLHLVDPFAAGKAMNSVGLTPNDDLLFLRLVSLPKGRKLLSRYLCLLTPGSDIARIVCMAIFRHLRFLFGSLPSDSGAAETTRNLASAASTCIRGMDLKSLSACLAAVVCSSEQPPLRPLGSASGDGASVVIISTLERATELLTNYHAAADYSAQNRVLWQASFDAFFGLLTDYCKSKYDSIMQSLVVQNPYGADVGSEVAKAVSREIPVELLWVSLPHTNEQQRKLLLDFARRSMPVTAYNAPEAGNGPITPESVHG